MNRRQIVYLCVALCLVTAAGTHASSTATLQRQAGADIVTQGRGLIVVDQTVSGYNATQNTADVTVSVTNQREVRIPPVRVGIGDDSVPTSALAPGESATVRFSDVDCTETIRVKSNMGNVNLRTTTSVAC
jgi:Flp pilus assembly protein TadG